MVNYTENVAHAHAVDTRPSLPLPTGLRRPGDEANYVRPLHGSYLDKPEIHCNIPRLHVHMQTIQQNLMPGLGKN